MRARAFTLVCLFSFQALASEPPAKLLPREALQATVPAPAPAAEKRDGITGQWWFWTAIGVVAVGAFAGLALAASKPDPRPTTLPDGDFR